MLAGVADGLADTADVYVAADRNAAPGVAHDAPVTRPPTPPDSAVVAPPSTGPGALESVPDWLAEYVPGVDPRALDRAADQWRRLGEAAVRTAIDADEAMSTVLSANRGPVFDAVRRYWSTVGVPCRPDTLLDLAGTAPNRLASHLETLAVAVRRAQRELLGAVERSTPPGGDPTTWQAIRVATIGLGFLGLVGRAGVAIVDVEELALRALEARRRYLADVDAAVAGFDRSLEERITRAVAGVHEVGDVSAALTGTSTAATSTLPRLTIDRKQIEKKYDEHASVFGVAAPRGAAGFAELERRVRMFMQSPSTRRVVGTYRGLPAVLNYDTANGMLVIQNLDGSFLSGWHTNGLQLANIVGRYSL